MIFKPGDKVALIGSYGKYKSSEEFVVTECFTEMSSLYIKGRSPENGFINAFAWRFKLVETRNHPLTKIFL